VIKRALVNEPINTDKADSKNMYFPLKKPIKHIIKLAIAMKKNRISILYSKTSLPINIPAKVRADSTMMPDINKDTTYTINHLPLYFSGNLLIITHTSIP